MGKKRGIENHGGYIRIGFTYNGEYHREPLGLKYTPTNVKFAEKQRAKVQLAITAGEFDYGAFFPNSKQAGPRIHADTLEQWYKAWLGETKLEKSTLRGYDIAYRRLLRQLEGEDAPPPFSADTPLNAITLNWLKRWRKTAAEQYAPKSVNNSLVVLRGVFRVAFEAGAVPKNLPLRLHNISDPPRRDRIDPFTRAEVEAIIAANPGAPALLVETWFCCGFRPGEVMALQWEDVDFQHRRVRVHRNHVLGQTKETKTGLERHVRLTRRAIGALKHQRAISALAGEHVFLNPNTGESWGNDQALRKNFIRWCKRADVRVRPPKCLRHTYISLALAGGRGVFEVAKQVGHTDLKMMMDNYAAWIPTEDFDEQYSAIFG